MGDLRIGVAGLGYWGPNLVRALAATPGAVVTHLADPSEKARGKASSLAPGAAVLPSLDELLARDIDAVVLATPADRHAEDALKVISAGRDCFVEKPLTLRTEDALGLKSAVEASGRILMVGHLLEYHPAIEKVKGLLDAGDLGDLLYLYARRVNLGIIRSSENALWSLAPHDIAVACYLTGEAPLSASADGSSFLQEGIHDVVFYRLDFPGGRFFHGHVSWLDPQKVREITVVGSRKMAVIDDAVSTDKLKVFDKGVETHRQPFTEYGQYLSIRAGDCLIPRIPSTEPLKAEMLHFVEAVRERGEPRSGIGDGLRVVAALEALETSLAGGGIKVPVTIP